MISPYMVVDGSTWSDVTTPAAILNKIDNQYLKYSC